MRTENNHRSNPEAGRAKIPVNFIVIFLICCLPLAGCKVESNEINPDEYNCNAEQLKLVNIEYEICKDSSYFTSFCFAQAKDCKGKITICYQAR